VGYNGSVTPGSTKCMKKMKNTQLANPASYGARQFCIINRFMKSSLLNNNVRNILSNEFLSNRTNTRQDFSPRARHILHSN
jgi:hypothetical protein